jgi:hypothetical protein
MAVAFYSKNGLIKKGVLRWWKQVQKKKGKDKDIEESMVEWSTRIGLLSDWKNEYERC